MKGFSCTNNQGCLATLAIGTEFEGPSYNFTLVVHCQVDQGVVREFGKHYFNPIVEFFAF